jgi:hypothetical protein
MGLVVMPIVDGKLEAWKEWAAELQGPRRADFEDLNRRHRLTRHDAWLAETPAGPIVVVLHEGPGADSFVQDILASDHEVDNWFAGKVMELHGVDPNQPLPPMPEKHIES